MFKLVLNMFCGNFSEKKICPVFHGGSRSRRISRNQKLFKLPKMPKIVPKSVQTCFEHVLGWFFREFFCPVFLGGSSLQLLLVSAPNNGISICRMLGKKLKLRRPALPAIILHCGKKSAVIAPPHALKDSYTRFLPKAQTYLNWMFRTPKSEPYITALPKNNLS